MFLMASSLVLAAGCRGPATYVHPNADLRDMKVVAVLPFENLSTDRAAGERVQQLLLAELMAKSAFTVVEPGLVTAAVSELGDRRSLAPDDLKKLGEKLHAEGLFLGTIVSYREPHGRNAGAEVTLQLRLVEARSGMTLWSATDTRNGAGFTTKLLGLTGQTTTELARTLVREQLATLIE
jgi:TolB-like protein